MLKLFLVLKEKFHAVVLLYTTAILMRYCGTVTRLMSLIAAFFFGKPLGKIPPNMDDWEAVAAAGTQRLWKKKIQ